MKTRIVFFLIFPFLISCKQETESLVTLKPLIETDVTDFNNVSKTDNLFGAPSSKIALSDSILLITDYPNEQTEISKIWLMGKNMDISDLLLEKRVSKRFSYENLVKKYNLKEYTIANFFNRENQILNQYQSKKLKLPKDDIWDYNTIIKISKSGIIFQLYLNKDGYYYLRIWYRQKMFVFPQKSKELIESVTINLYDINNDGKEELFIAKKENLFGRKIELYNVKVYELNTR